MSTVDAPDILVKCVQSLVADIQEVPTVAGMLRHVPKLAACVNSLQIPGSDKKALVLLALHTLSAQLEESQKITGEFRKELDDFVDATVPVTIDSVLDVVKGRVSVAEAAQDAVTNPVVVSEVVTCCTGFFTGFLTGLINKEKAKTKAAPVPPTPAPTPASVPSTPVGEGVDPTEATEAV